MANSPSQIERYALSGFPAFVETADALLAERQATNQWELRCGELGIPAPRADQLIRGWSAFAPRARWLPGSLSTTLLRKAGVLASNRPWVREFFDEMIFLLHSDLLEQHRACAAIETVIELGDWRARRRARRSWTFRLVGGEIIDRVGDELWERRSATRWAEHLEISGVLDGPGCC